uniref:Ficolin-1-like n=1 Tax=Crassostrea virginica TaxID=6565 RepID=A0A8B8BWA9_CRAVI|nr:ficolin-1-like [Crassostrea virginica]
MANHREKAHGYFEVLQRRISGSIDFNRSWSEYVTGFGNLQGNFWIGNDVIYQLTRTENVTLYVSITLAGGVTKYQEYQSFSMGNNSEKYRLFLQGPSQGTLGDSMVSTEYTGKLNRNLPGMLFSTYDQDNDRKSNGNCASLYGGGWWFNWCYVGYLNGPWKDSQWSSPWYPTVTTGTDIYGTLIMIRPN